MFLKYIEITFREPKSIYIDVSITIDMGLVFKHLLIHKETWANMQLIRLVPTESFDSIIQRLLKEHNEREEIKSIPKTMDAAKPKDYLR